MKFELNNNTYETFWLQTDMDGDGVIEDYLALLDMSTELVVARTVGVDNKGQDFNGSYRSPDRYVVSFLNKIRDYFGVKIMTWQGQTNIILTTELTKFVEERGGVVK